MARALDKTYAPGMDVIFDGSLSHDNDSQTKGFTPKWQWDFEYDYDLDVFTADITTTVSTTSKKYLYPCTYVVAVKYIDDDGVEGSVYKFTITITNVKRYYYLKDHLGSIRQTIDDKGVVVEKQDYSSYGAILTGRSMNTASSNEKYKFTEKERDKESGLDYFGARYYDSEIGRWLSIDPLADKYLGWISYSYFLDNPLNNYDPYGKIVLPKYGNYNSGFGKISAGKSTSLQAWCRQTNNAARNPETKYYLGKSLSSKFSTICRRSAISENKGNTNEIHEIINNSTASSCFQSKCSVAFC